MIWYCDLVENFCSTSSSSLQPPRPRGCDLVGKYLSSSLYTRYVSIEVPPCTASRAKIKSWLKEADNSSVNVDWVSYYLPANSVSKTGNNVFEVEMRHLDRSARCGIVT